MFQRKEQDKMPEKLLIEMDISSLLDREFKVMLVKVLTGLERMDELRVGFNIGRKYKKEPVRAEECSNCNEKYTRRN